MKHQHNIIRTGLKDLDLNKGELILIAGRPNMGTTTLALNISRSIWNYIPVLYFSCDLNQKELITRITHCTEEVDSDRVYEKFMNSEMKILSKILEYRSRFKFYTDFDTYTISTIKKKYYDWLKIQRLDTGIIIIDRLELLEEKSIVDAICGLKSLAKELDIPIILLNKLPQEIEYRLNKRPTLEDLEKYDIPEKYIDKILFMYRDDYYNSYPKTRGIVEIIIAKNSTEKNGTVKVLFDKNTGVYKNIYS